MTERRFRRLLYGALLGPFPLWWLKNALDLDLAWQWALIIPGVIGCYLAVTLLRNQMPRRGLFAVLTTLAVGFWLLGGIISIFNEDAPTHPFPTQTPGATT